MKTTTRMFDIIKSELLNRGEDEFINKVNGHTQLTPFNKNYMFTRRIIRYDTLVAQICNEEFFEGFTFENSDLDFYFKKMLINRFVNREIAFQTVELFSSHLVNFILQHEQYIINLYEHFDDFVSGKTDSKGGTHDKSGYNNGYQDLPQDEVNLDLHANEMDYATTNTIQRAFDDKTNDSTNHAYNADTLLKLEDAWDKLFKKLDKACFLQVW